MIICPVEILDRFSGDLFSLQFFFFVFRFAFTFSFVSCKPLTYTLFTIYKKKYKNKSNEKKEKEKKYNKQRARWLRWSDRGEMKASFTKRNLLELLISKGAKHSLPIFKTSINTSALAYNAVLSLSSLNTELTEHHTSNKSDMTQNFSSACPNLKIGDFLCIFARFHWHSNKYRAKRIVMLL